MDPTQIINQLLSAAGISPGTLPESVDLSLWSILRSILVLVLFYFLARFARSFLERTFKRVNLEPRVSHVLLPIVYYGILALGVVWVLGGIGLTVIVLTVVVGLALQDLIKNFASGMLILATRPFRPGDWIGVEGKEGIVTEVGWRGTFIDTFDGRRVIVPNINIVTNVVTNNSIKPQLRHTLNYSVSLDMDFGRVESLILETLAAVPGVSTDPAPRVLLKSVSGDAMNVAVMFWVLEPMKQFPFVISDAQRAIVENLQEKQVVLNPATTVVMSKGSGEKILPQ